VFGPRPIRCLPILKESSLQIFLTPLRKISGKALYQKTRPSIQNSILFANHMSSQNSAPHRLATEGPVSVPERTLGSKCVAIQVLLSLVVCVVLAL
jgi:hypothetical protein